MRHLLICLLFISGSSIAQEELPYFINQTDSGQYLVDGKAYLINPTKNSCYEYAENTDIQSGKKYTIIRFGDEMDNLIGVVIFDKKGNQIDYQAVQEQRKKHYKPYNCCVYVQEFKGNLYFWDIIEPDEDGADYDCANDSQTDASDYIIPRYYIFNPKKGSVVMKVLQNKCTRLIVDGKLNCMWSI